MKINEQETEHGGGEDRKIYTLLLHDMHGEYTGDFEQRPVNFDDGFGETDLWWQTSRVQDALQHIFEYDADTAERQTARLMPEFLPAAFIDREGDYIEWVWRITGSREYLAVKFEELRQRLMPCKTSYEYDGQTREFWQPSGDDDVFDYFPNTMDMLWDFAKDLDEITDAATRQETNTYRRKVWELLDRMVEIGVWEEYLPDGESAFEWSADARWGYQKERTA